MIIRLYPITPRRGNEPSAQGNALGYLLAGLSGRLSDINSPLTPAINYGLKPCCQTAVTPSQKL